MIWAEPHTLHRGLLMDSLSPPPLIPLLFFLRPISRLEDSLFERERERVELSTNTQQWARRPSGLLFVSWHLLFPLSTDLIVLFVARWCDALWNFTFEITWTRFGNQMLASCWYYSRFFLYIMQKGGREKNNKRSEFASRFNAPIDDSQVWKSSHNDITMIPTNQPLCMLLRSWQ